jgi:hypothetical protein
MSNVITLPTVTKLDISPASVLDGAKDADLDTVLVIGFDSQGNIYAASSTGDTAENVLLVEMFKHKLLSGEFDS